MRARVHCCRRPPCAAVPGPSWFPEAFAFAVMAVAVMTIAALVIGVAPRTVADSFGSGFWSLIPFSGWKPPPIPG